MIDVDAIRHAIDTSPVVAKVVKELRQEQQAKAAAQGHAAGYATYRKLVEQRAKELT